MILCFLLSVNTAAAAASSVLIQGQYRSKTVFYRKNPPPPIVASAKREAEARGYIDKMKTATDQLTSPIQSGRFSINGNKSVDKGQLVIFSTGTGADIKRYKAFINDRASINDVKATDLDYFSNLFDDRDDNGVVKWSQPTEASPATASNPVSADTKENERIKMEDIRQSIENEELRFKENKKKFKNKQDAGKIVTYILKFKAINPSLCLDLLKIINTNNFQLSSEDIVSKINHRLSAETKPARRILKIQRNFGRNGLKEVFIDGIQQEGFLKQDEELTESYGD